MKATWLFAYDLSKEAAPIIDEVARELAALKGKLLIVHVNSFPLRPSSIAIIARNTTFENAEEFSNAVSLRVKKQLNAVKKDLTKRFPKLKVDTLMREGNAVEELIGVCKEKKVDRLVVSTHSRRGVGRILMGSVAERIVRLSPVSVLVVKSKAE